MELQFEKTAWECLRGVVSQTKNEEHTMEVRLPESMPDIGRVLCAWGEVLLRGKEWRGSGMGISGGVMAWVLYQSEDGSEIQSVEGWIPFQTKWDFPQTERDGSVWASCLLRNIDARSLSARKLMIRAAVSIMAEALEPVRMDVYHPGNVPKDVHLLTQSYPVRIAREAGEKSFALDEEILVPAEVGSVEKLVRWELHPEIVDQKVMAGKVVFRGSARVHILFLDSGNAIKSWSFEIPFSQFEDLQREYGPEAEVRIIPAVTGMDMDVLAPDKLHLKAGLVGQYVITDRPVLEVVEDAYSNERSVKPTVEELPIPAVLDSRRVSVKLEDRKDAEGTRILDTSFYYGQPGVHREEGTTELEQSGSWQVLTEDGEGRIQGQVLRADSTVSFVSDDNSRVTAYGGSAGAPQGDLMSGQLAVRSEVWLDTQTILEQGIPMVTGLELGETAKPDPERPSMILRRTGKARLWDIAKASGSTVEAIRTANRLDGEPMESQMLLIPVI